MGCCDGYCNRCKGIKKALLGVLILLNAFVWPLWTWNAMTGFDGWIKFAGVVLVIFGVIAWIKPCCGCEGCEMPVAKGKKK